MNLSLLIIIPLVTAIAVLLVKSKLQVKWISLIGAVLQIIISLFCCFTMNLRFQMAIQNKCFSSNNTNGFLLCILAFISELTVFRLP